VVHPDAFEIFWRSDHRRPADSNVLNQSTGVRSGFASVASKIEIADTNRWGDLVFGPSAAVTRIAAAEQDSAMNFRVQLSSPAREHLGPSRPIVTSADRDSIFAHKPRQCPSRNDLDAERRGVAAPKSASPLLVIHLTQRAFHGHGISGDQSAKRLF